MMATLEQDTVTGRIKSIFFQNPTNFYKILLVEITATTITWPEAEIVVTGSLVISKKTVSTRLSVTSLITPNTVTNSKRTITRSKNRRPNRAWCSI